MSGSHSIPEARRSRRIESLHPGQRTQDGAGVQLTRLLSGALQYRLDPFLMLDLFGSDTPEDYLGGFPTHPHRGFETITYMLYGRMRHRDSAGNEGLLESGGLQWMTAGRGVLHSEMPEQERGRMAGFQLWLNLPARDKMSPPWYRDFGAADLPRWQAADGTEIRVLAGRFEDRHGLVHRPGTDPQIFDLRLAPNSACFVPLPTEHNAFIVSYSGDVSVAATPLPTEQLAILGNDPEASGVDVSSQGGGAALLVAGRPLGEPIVQYGPFVMNTQEEIREALEAFRRGTLVP